MTNPPDGPTGLPASGVPAYDDQSGGYPAGTGYDGPPAYGSTPAYTEPTPGYVAPVYPDPTPVYTGSTDDDPSKLDTAKDAAGTAKDAAKDTASTAKDAALDTAGTAKDAAKETAATAKDEAAAVKDTAVDAGKNVAATAKDEASNVVAETAQQAKSLLGSATSQLKEQAGVQQGNLAAVVHSFAKELGGMASKSEESGPLTDLVHQASRRAGEIGHFLDDKEPSDVLAEVNRFARRRPGTFLLLCGLAGVVAGRITRGAVAANTSVDSPSYDASGARRAVEPATTGVYAAPTGPDFVAPAASLVDETPTTYGTGYDTTVTPGYVDGGAPVYGDQGTRTDYTR
jgi:hypothetical protein